MKPLKKRWQAWFAKRFPASRGETVIATNKVYILPSSLGWGFVAALIVLTLIGINYSNNLIYGLGFWLGSMALIAMVQTHRQLPGLSLRLQQPAAVFAGENIAIQLLVTAPEKRIARGLSLSVAWAESADNSLQDVEQRLNLEAGEQRLLELLMPAKRRGLFTAPLLRIGSDYPLGLFQAWSFVHQPQQCLVYPAPAEEQPLPAPTPLTHKGSSAVSQQPGSDEYGGLRPYRVGDAVKHIAWKSLAKKGPQADQLKADGTAARFEDDLLTKAFYAEAANEWRFSFNAALAQAGEQEAALSLLCRWLLDARAARLAYSLDVPDAADGPGGADAELASLAMYGQEYGQEQANA